MGVPAALSRAAGPVPRRRRRRRPTRRRACAGGADVVSAPASSPAAAGKLVGLGRSPAGRRPRRRHAPRSLLLAHRLQQRHTLILVAEREVLPPFGKFDVDLAGIGAQAQEVVGRAIAGLLDQRARRVAAAALEARLHQPDLAHVGRQLAAPGDVADARIEDRIHRLLQCGERRLAVRLQGLPALQHLVPQQAGQQEARRHRQAFGHAPVGVGQRQLHEALARRVLRRRLQHRVEDREHAAVEPVAPQFGQALQRMAGLQQLDHLVEQARGRNIGQQRRHLADRRGRLRLDREAQLGGEAHDANDAHRVLAVARGRVADHAQHALLRVLEAVVVVDHDLPGRVVVQRIHGEVAARCVLDLRPPDVVAQHAAAGVDHVGLAAEFLLRRLLVAADLVGRGRVEQRTEGRDLDHLVLAATAEDHMHDAEAPADDERAAEQRLHLLRRRIGGDVEVLRTQTQQQVAHRAADHVGLVPGLLQRADDAHRRFVEQTLVDAVFGRADLHALAERHRGLAGGRLAEQPVDELLDHAKSLRMGQPRAVAMRSSAGAGLVATGWLTRSSSARSLVESL